ncbi:MAG TPA: pitrilysin family protein [Armatimonadota bacterium]|jgi:predicted Zn-dependent peptidase
MRRFSQLWVLPVLILTPAFARSVPKPDPNVPKVAYTSYTLPNGLRVFFSRDTTAPVVSVNLVYNVGSFVEPPGRTGFAHLFEHMMFQGSKNVGKGEHTQLVIDNGGTMNGGTSFDFTVYYETVPANQLELALFLEADRMGTLDVSQVNLDNQRAVVKEERRMRYENQPYGTIGEHLQDLAYIKSPYKHVPIGSMDDLNRADLAYVRRFFHTFYAPNNAVLCVAGDFDPARAKALIAKYYGRIKRGPKPVLPSLSEPPQKAERRVAYKDKLAPLPTYVAGYHIPNGNDKDAPALDMLSSILSGGKSARLWQSLVEKQQVCTSVSSGANAGRGPDLFSFRMAFGPGQSVEKAEKALYAEIQKIQKDGVTHEEMQTARTQALQSSIEGRRTSLGRAMAIGISAVVYGDPNRVNTELSRFYAVTAADVKRVARKYLVSTNRSVVIAEAGAARGGAQ